MKTKHDNPNPRSEHERRNEGGREYGHVHEPTQARMASSNKGLADDRSMGNRHQQQAPAHQSGSGTSHSSSESNRGSGSQQGRPPGNASRQRGSEHEKRSA